MATNFWKGGPGLSSSPAAGSLGRRSRSRPSGSADAYKIPDRWILWVPFQDRGGRSEQEELARGTSKRNWYRPKIRPLRRISKRERWHGLRHFATRYRGFPNCGKIGFRGPPIPGGRTFSFTVPAKNPAAADCRRFRFPMGGNGAPGGARRMRPSATMRNGSAPRSGSRR